jgi:hypothetical protein
MKQCIAAAIVGIAILLSEESAATESGGPAEQLQKCRVSLKCFFLHFAQYQALTDGGRGTQLEQQGRYRESLPNQEIHRFFHCTTICVPVVDTGICVAIGGKAGLEMRLLQKQQREDWKECT